MVIELNLVRTLVGAEADVCREAKWYGLCKGMD